MKSDTPPQLSVPDDGAGHFLRFHRTRNGITQQQLADEAGFKQSYLAKIESGARVAPLETVLILANAVGRLAAEKRKAS